MDMLQARVRVSLMAGFIFLQTSPCLTLLIGEVCGMWLVIRTDVCALLAFVPFPNIEIHSDIRDRGTS
ncbi:hypothetical protein BDU57DRAFT_518520 [Ampelomyces quisqualis]|uniref:Uncharacterized protein n=1 Tax=Ampelomyces quisqualis TaxID=50730 RepID=A0A6A5QN93_AMPQU|nr:hypothetical protein BDU57DRAFT_518520 [Ampelomyces quisqualis]